MVSNGERAEPLEEVISRTPLRIHPERFAYLLVDQAPVTGEHLMVFSNGDDQTVVTAEANLESLDPIGVERWYRLLEFRIPTPFGAPGFLARIASSLAERGLNILILSTFPRDYCLVREEDLSQALEALFREGFKGQRDPR